MAYAKQNILRNDLKHRIRPLLTKADDALFPFEALGLDEYLLSNITREIPLKQE